MKICIDPGHGGKDPGCSGFDKIEKFINLEYATLLKNELLKYKDVEIIMTRKGDIYLGLNERCVIANNNDCDLFISCHVNACDKTARGTEVIYGVNSIQLFIDFCNRLGKQLSSNLGIPFRRAFSRPATNGKGDYYTVIHNTNMKAIIVEALFLDNKEDNAKYNPYIISQTIAKCVADHYCLKLNAVNQEVLKKGSKGEKVKVLQIKLNQFVESLKLSVDGDFGSLTEKVVKLYQQEKGLTVDGIAGSITQKSLGM